MNPTANSPGRFVRGFFSFFRGFEFIMTHRLWRYMILPSLLSLAVFGGLIYGIFSLLDLLVKEFLQVHLSESVLPIVIIHLFLWIASFGLTFIFYRTVASLVVLPFLGPLLNRAEIILTGKALETGLSQDIKNTFLGFYISLKFAFLSLLLWFFSLITGPMQILVLALSEGYFIGREIMDLILEKETNTLKERNRLAHEYFPEFLGLGLAYFIVLLIPIAGVFIAPPSAVVGAALLRYGEKKDR